MKKRLAFRSFVILLATALLLSSTGAYNLLVYANQDSVANSLSAIESASGFSVDAESSEPEISVQGGELTLDSDVSIQLQAAEEITLEGEGTQQNPYIIMNASDFLEANKIVNAQFPNLQADDTSNKYFRLGANIDLSPLFAEGVELPFPEKAGNAYLVSTNFRQPTSDVVRFILDGTVRDTQGNIVYEENGDVKKYVIGCSEGTRISVPHENFALFGYLNEKSEISNVIFENINVAATSDQPKRMAVISYMNAGTISNCEIVDSKIELVSPDISSENTDGSSVTIDSYVLYNGIAAAVSDNRSRVESVKVNNFTVNLPTKSSNDYVAGLVGQNRGIVDSSSVFGIKLNITSNNHYIGGLVGYNETSGTENGIKNCAVDFAGTANIKNNITDGGYVGGLVGYNKGYVYSSTVTGSVTSAQAATASSYNIYCGVDCGEDFAYYGGITSVNNGEIVSSTVHNVGAYMKSALYNGYYGGIAAVTTGTISGCVATGSFLSDNETYGYAGGIIAFADSNTPDGAISNCYALVRLINPAREYIGAVIGFGGNAAKVSGCYWSDAISKCATAYVFTDTADSRRPYILETSAGKLVSSNRAVVVERGDLGNLSAADNTHAFNVIEGTTAAIVTVSDDVSYTGSGSNNTLITKSYLADFDFAGTGAGASSMQNLPVSIALDIFVTSNATGDPDYDPSKGVGSPFEIKSTAMAQYIHLAPYGNYKLTTDIAVTESSWTKTIFTGSIYGDDNIIATNTKLFTAVIGTRDKGPYYKEDAVSDPNLDTANRKGGYISNLNFELSADIDQSVLGTIYDSTIVNVALSDGDPTPDDGDETVYEGYIADLSKAPAYSAAFIDCAVGNSYIYGCSTDVSVKFGATNYVAGFIAYVSGAVVVDNCFVNAISVYVSGDSNEISRAAFIANSVQNSKGLIANSIVSSRVIGSTYVYTVFGEHAGVYSSVYKNIVWSKLSFASTNRASNIEQESVSLWGGESVPTQSVMAGGDFVWTVDIPQHVTAFEGASVSDFTVSLINIDSNNNETAYEADKFTIEGITVENGKLNVTVKAATSAQVGDSVYLKVVNFETGFQTYVKYLVKSSDFITQDGYIILSTKEDLVMLSNKVNPDSENKDLTYLSKAYKLDANISMGDTVIPPIGSNAYPFTGIFDGNNYEISGLTITSTNDNSALFAVVDFSEGVSVNGVSVDSGIYNLKIRDFAVAGGDSTAVLVGTGIDKVNIHDIEISDSSAIGTGKSVAAVVASMKDCDADIYNVTLNGVTVQTSYTDGAIFFKDNAVVIGGIGAIIGSAEESDTEAHTINVYGVTANNIVVAGPSIGNDYGYATVNAGGLIGTYQKYYETAANMSASSLNIGREVPEDEADFDITVSNLTVRSAGNAGGIVAATNAKTTIKNVKVSADSEKGTTIHSTTELYIGGIAGYVGPYRSYDNADAIEAVSKIYGFISNAVVENAEIKATDINISSPTAVKNRNVVVGGIVGAVNGPAEGDTLVDCVLKNSLVEGVVVGGIVGANIMLYVNIGNVLHINNCDVFLSVITTVKDCVPCGYSLETYDFGVGGILGTNTANYNSYRDSYISDVNIKYCDVDFQTIITNYIECDNETLKYFSATGGIVGLATQYKSTGTQLKLSYNTVSAQITSVADMNVVSEPYHTDQEYWRVGTGGFIGFFRGIDLYSEYVAYTQYLSITDSVFDGSIIGTDCIGGAIGSITSAFCYEYSEETHLPKDLLKNIVISGSLKSTLANETNTMIRGGVTIGSIVANTDSYIAGGYSGSGFALEMVIGDDMSYTFSNIYYSSFAIDTTTFPFMGYCGADKSNNWSNYIPTYFETFSLIVNCYYDVNLKGSDFDNGNVEPQLTDYSSGTEFVGYVFPEVNRGEFRLDTADKNGKKPHWVGSNPSIATVSDTEYNSLTVTPKNPETIDVSIDYIGSVTDGEGWSYEARLPVGFKFTSTAFVPLQTVNYNGTTYRLITDPIDFKLIKDEALAYNYWLANDIVFTENMFDPTNGMYKGGFTPIGTSSAPFTGTFGSRKDAGNEQFEISGLQLTASADTNKVAGLFGYTQNASFDNFKITDVTSTADVNYAAAVAAVATGSLNATNVTVENAHISGADYTAGLFGGLFSAGQGANSWNISESKLIGERTADSSYTTTIQGDLASAGIVVHTDKNAASIKGVTVSGSAIIQGTENDTDDSTYFDNGAAGIAFAYSGDISANGNKRNTVKDSLVKGEIAAGAVVRTYTSNANDVFSSFSSNTNHASVVAERVSINAVDIFSTIVEGTHIRTADKYSYRTISSAGIIARVDAPSVNHTVTDCTLDEQTTVKAPYGVGGIVGCFEAPTDTSIIRVYNIVIDSCNTSATVTATESDNTKITDTSNLYYNMGAGGIIGSLSKDTYLSGIHISNCHVGGTISGDSAVGGLVGAIWTSGMIVDEAKFNEMNHHFAENCVISASFKNLAGEDSFVKKTTTTGIVVGYIYDFEANGSNGVMVSGSSFSGYTNQPFFNIYYSGYKYPSGSAYLFGVLKPVQSGNDNSANTKSGLTDYIYDINSYKADKENEPGIKNHTINEQTRALTFGEQYRIKHKDYDDEENITPINSLLFATGYPVALSDFSFDALPQNVSDKDLNYIFDSAASINGFTVSAVNKGETDTALEQTAVLMPESVKTDSNKISVKAAEGGYVLAPADGVTLTETVEFNLVFTYSNGMELAAAFVVEVSGNDYYRYENTYFVFNASNLYSTIEKVNASSTIIQCYDIFCAIENGNALINSANSYAENVTLSQVMSAEDLALLAASVHPNPKFEAGVDERTEIDIEEYLGVTDLANVKLSKLVDGVSATQYGTYTKNSSDHFDLDFAGTYRVLSAIEVEVEGAVIGTGLTQAGDYFSIYGFESHEDVNVTAQGEDAEKSGFFNSLNGATVTGLTFVNPKIEVIGSRDAENFVGVLAGSAVGATITDVSVERIGTQGEAYVMSLRQMIPASTNVGGIVGSADAATKINNCSVSGLDVVGATLAGNTSGKLYTVKVGGIAGSSAAEIVDASVSDSRILAERYDIFRNTYVSYAGGIAAWATGNITNAEVNNTQLRDATCSVNVTGTTAAGSYVANADDHELVADRIGGIVAHSYGNVNIASAKLHGVSITAFDTAGGIIGEIENDDGAAVNITNSNVGDYAVDGSNADIRVLSSSNLSTSNLRQFYNVAGGIVGKVDNLASLNINGSGFSGYVGTYSYDNLNKDCTAGGVIGYISEQLEKISSLTVVDTTVSGEVSGFRSGKTAPAFEPYLGAAGGYIGKIRSTVSDAGETPLVSHGVMSAEVNLYTNSTGTMVDATNATVKDPQSVSTNVGKLLGFAIVGNNFATSAEDLTAYFENIYVSSYPQDIIAYGCEDFYGQKNTAETYTDINVATYTYTEDGTEYTENGKSFMVGTSEDISISPADDKYSSSALIPLDTEDIGEEGVSASRHFRLVYNDIKFKSDDTSSDVISYNKENGAHIVLNEGETSAVISIDNYEKPYGTLTISQVKEDIIGDLVLTYSYGLEVGIRLITVEIEGMGEEDDPYLISTPKHFDVVRALPDAYYKQVNNIDLAPQYGYSTSVTSPLWAKGQGFEPIGTKQIPFIGSYDGGGYLITNLYINRSSDYVGLFGCVGSGAELKNIHIELAGPMTVNTNPENFNITADLVGGITANSYVGGLAGRVNNATVTNCSVVKGNVIGDTALGGLIGESAGATIDSCFTSTTVYSKLTGKEYSGQNKNAGALVGFVSGTTSVSGSFTFGYVSLGVKESNDERIYGAVGGLAGYVGTNAKLEISDVFVGASVSDSNGINFYKGLTIGGSNTQRSDITAKNVRISAAVAATQVGDTDKINPVLGVLGGVTVPDDAKGSVIYDADLMGIAAEQAVVDEQGNPIVDENDEVVTEWVTVVSDESGVTPASGEDFSLNGVTLAANAGTDAYTLAYVELAKLQVDPSAKEITDRQNNTLYKDGLFYPVTVMGEGIIASSSRFDTSDNLDDYPSEMDTELYGDGKDKSIRNTDLLFENVQGGIKVYINIFKEDAEKYTGEVLKNGEMFYNDRVPYFVVTDSAPVTVDDTSVELYRKVVYPVQVRNDSIGRIYPISTERQLNSIGIKATDEYGKVIDTKFVALTPDKSYTLTDDIVLGNYKFNPIPDYSGRFEGNGFKLSNLNIEASDNTGFISTMLGGSLSNMVLEIGTVSGGNNVGALVGSIQPAEGKTVNITNCSVSHLMKDKEPADGETTEKEPVGSGVIGSNNVGGLVGYAKGGTGSIISHSFTQVTVSGTNVVGGLVGYNEMAVDNSYATGDVNASITGTYSGTHGIGGLVGVSNGSAAVISSSFSSSAVDVGLNDGMTYITSSEYGVGGLVGHVGDGAQLSGVFSSGGVRYSYSDGDSEDDNETGSSVELPSCQSLTLGVGGLVGVLGSSTLNVYSSASVAAKFGDVSAASAVGAGGLFGVIKAGVEYGYSSGSTLAEPRMKDYSSANYGVGGVIGVIAGGVSAKHLRYDLNVSAIEYDAETDASQGSVGKVISGSFDNAAQATTAQFIDGSSLQSELGGSVFGYTPGAYPYLKALFNENVSRTIQFNALLSVVAIELNPLDQMAAEGKGISMAMNIPTEVTHNGTAYTFGFEADNTQQGSAKAIVDPNTNTLSVQRSSNKAEQANFIITIETVGGQKVDPSDGVVYSTVASRPLSRICAQMLGTDDYPFLVASQEDMKHVAMTSNELTATAAADPDSLYLEWNEPLDANTDSNDTKVYYRMMGNVYLDGTYTRPVGFAALAHGYSFDGNGYFVHGLRETLADTVNESSVITNVTFKDTVFSEGESLVGNLDGIVRGVNVFSMPVNEKNTDGTLKYTHTKSSGNNVAGIAQTVNKNGIIEGCVVNLDWEGTANDSFAGIALTNNGTIAMSASVGDITGSANSAAAFVGENNNTISTCFTMGDILLDSPTSSVSGFVGTNNSAITNCYTRCNIIVRGENSGLNAGSFAANNGTNGTINACYAAGLFTVDNAGTTHVFVGHNDGSINDSMFDKQMSGSSFADDFYLAERTLEVATLSNMNIMVKGAYQASTGKTAVIDGVETVVDIEYPQLKAILDTKVLEETGEADKDGNKIKEETEQSLMYRTLRSYSNLSSAGAMVNNDNYIDYLPYGTDTVISSKFIWKMADESVAEMDDFAGGGKYFTTNNKAASTIISVRNPDITNKPDLGIEIEEYHSYTKEESKIYDTYNLHITVNNNPNPNFSGGNGTEETPYIIATKEQVVALSYYGSNPDSYFIIGEVTDAEGNDIDDITNGALDMTGTDWGAYIDLFSANLDGRGYTLSNVTIPPEGDNALIGVIDGGNISNLGIAGITITVPEGNTDAAGMLAAKAMNNTSTITNCVVVGTVTGPDGKAATSEYIGGLIGDAQGPVIIDGCVVSGKVVNSEGSAGGVIGKAENGVSVTNSLSTVLVDGGNSSAGGIIGSGPANTTDSVSVSNTVFAGNVNGATVGNIAGDGKNITVTNSYYDKQLSMVAAEESGVTAASTHYLTTALVSDFVSTMGRINSFSGYPVPAAIASAENYGDAFMNAVKLASAKISFVNGTGAGTSKVFTGIAADDWGAILTVTGNVKSDYFNGKTSGTSLTADTSSLALGETAEGEFTYTLADTSLVRYIDFTLGKTVKVVQYKLKDNGIADSSKAIISVVTGAGEGKSAATIFDSTAKSYEPICSNMIFAYDEELEAYTFTVTAQLDEKLIAEDIDVSFDNENVSADIIKNQNGSFTVVIGSEATTELVNFTTVSIDITAVEEPWGVHKLVSFF